MAGKPREDRSLVAARHLGLRLTDAEFTLLRAVVDATNSQLHDAGLPPMMNGTTIIKLLVLREAERLGVPIPRTITVPRHQTRAHGRRVSTNLTLSKSEEVRKKRKPQ